MEQKAVTVTHQDSEGGTTGLPQLVPVQKRYPLLHLGWAEPQMLWKEMKAREAKYRHSVAMFDHHPDLDPRKRAVLFSWLSEVCQVYRLHRETYHLALEFVDRFLLHCADVHTSRLQLTGVTALLLASKMEEIAPPKGTDFVYVTDGACDWNEVHALELFMSEKLSWKFTPPTPNTWLQLYLQTAASHGTQSSHTAVSPQHPPPRHLCGTNSDTSLAWDVSVLVECTKTIHLANADNTKRCGGRDPCRKIACPCVSDEVKGSDEVRETFNDSGNCDLSRTEEVEGNENKENEMGSKDRGDAVAAQEETNVKADVSPEKGKQQHCISGENGDPFIVCQQDKREGNTCTATEAEESSQEDNTLDISHKRTVSNGEKKTLDGSQERLRTRRDLSGEENIDVDLETEAEDAGFESNDNDDDDDEEEDDMEAMCYEEEAEEDDDDNVVTPLFCPQQYVKASQLMDLVVLDSNSLRFDYSVLAAAAVFHCVPCQDIAQLTGLTRKELDPCIDWMRIHKSVLETSPLRETWGAGAACEGGDNCHTVQDHFVSDSVWSALKSRQRISHCEYA
ncbi:uncharacterized protein LOC143285930 [Babylonia areolata]|uniref:uncharacterized protein LOC143285930 n=1 Tax=Babylonia areolata TaxID=304850 RepID=UPI003FD0F55D